MATDQSAAALRELKGLRKTVRELSGRVENLEELVKESHKVILALSQTYYWTAEWQAKEERADEDEALGRAKRYESVEALLQELNRVENAPI